MHGDAREASSEEIQGYSARDYFDCDVDTGSPAELAANYKGPETLSKRIVELFQQSRWLRTWFHCSSFLG